MNTLLINVFGLAFFAFFLGWILRRMVEKRVGD